MTDKMPDVIYAAPLTYPNDIGNEWCIKPSLGTLPYVRADLVIRKDDPVLDVAEIALKKMANLLTEKSKPLSENVYSAKKTLAQLQKLRGG